MRHGAGLLLITTLALLDPSAADAADIAEGAKLARTICAACHSIADDPGARSAVVDAPRFMDIAAAPATTETSLKVFLQSTHKTMPNFILSAVERDAVVGYILSLRK